MREHGWERPVAVPASLDELHGGHSGVVALPRRLAWSGAGERRYDLAVEHDRRMLYETVLTEGSLDDVRQYVDATELVRLWDELWLPARVQRAWAPLLAVASGG